MSRSKHSILLYVLLSPLGYLLLKHLHHVLLSFNLVQKAACRNSASILETYSAPGFSSLLDKVVCVLVRFCVQAINDPLCFPMTATLVGLATTAYAVMSVEQTRFNGSRFLTPFMITMGNIIGTGVIAPLAWLPWYGWSLSHHHKQTHVNIMNNKLKTSSNNSDKLKERINHLKQQQFSLPSIAPNYAFSIAIATLFGQFLPVALLVSHGPSLTQHNILASFQYFGIVYGLIKLVLPSCTTGLNEKTKNSESVRLLYAGVAGINAFLYYWVWIKWLQTTTSPDLMVKQWIELFFSLGTTGENPVTYMLMWDIVALFSTFTYWAWLEDGLEGVKTMLINSVFFGPGASLAIYTLKREGRIEATKL